MGKSKSVTRETVVHAYDGHLRVIQKRVTARREAKRIIISFGKPIEFARTQLQQFLWGSRTVLCIDREGRLHGGSPVYIHQREVQRAYNWAMGEIKRQDAERGRGK